MVLFDKPKSYKVLFQIDLKMLNKKYEEYNF